LRIGNMGAMVMMGGAAVHEIGRSHYPIPGKINGPSWAAGGIMREMMEKGQGEGVWRVEADTLPLHHPLTAQWTTFIRCRPGFFGPGKM
jgi:hypothetical protein